MKKIIIATAIVAAALIGGHSSAADASDPSCGDVRTKVKLLRENGWTLKYSGTGMSFGDDEVHIWTTPEGEWIAYFSRPRDYCEIASGRRFIITDEPSR